MSDSMLGLLQEYGVWLVFANVLCTQLGLPIPAVPTLMVAGAFAAAGGVNLPAIVAASVAGALIADNGWYLVGRRYGYRVLAALCRFSLAPDLCVRQSETNYQRWGANLLLFAKFIPGVALVAPPLAGMVRMGHRRFLLFVGLGDLIWASTYIGIGYFLDRQFTLIMSVFDGLGYYVAAIAGLMVLAYIAYRFVQRQKLSRSFEMTRVTADDLVQLMQSAEAPVLVDVRSTVARNLDSRRIPDAVHLEVSELRNIRAIIPADTHLVVFCACPNEVSAAYMAMQLRELGYRSVSPLKNGIDGWCSAGLPLETDTVS